MSIFSNGVYQDNLSASVTRDINYLPLEIPKPFLESSPEGAQNGAITRAAGGTHFIDYKDKYYTYNRDGIGGKKYVIAAGLLNSLFKTYGYCVDPGTRSGISLTGDEIENLRTLALHHNDSSLVATINSLANGKVPSPRMMNDGIMHETTLNEKNRFDHLSGDTKINILLILKTILNIGLYLGGWKGNGEPYITSLRPNYDIIRVELEINPLIQSLYINPNYPLVKNYPVMGYYKSNPSSPYLSKPSVVDSSLNIDRCLNTISLGMSENYQQMASYLISTAYYYITTVCNTPLPMVEPLIVSLTEEI